MAGRRVAPTPPGSVLSLHSSDNASDAQHSDSSVSSHTSDDPRAAMQRALAVSHGSRRTGTGTPGGDREVARDSEMADIMREFDAQPVASVPEAPPRQARYPLYWLRRTLGCFACDVDLRDAVMDGYVEEVEDALKRAAATGEEAGHWVDLRQDASGYPALHLAIQMSRQDLSDMLIKNDYVNADPSRVDAQLRQSPLHHAVQASLVRAVGRLCKKGAFVDARDHAGMTPLHLAGACGELAICKELVLHGANPDLVDGGGWNALHHGAFGGHLPVVKFLLREGVEKDILDKKLCTAQHWAKFMGHGHVEAYLDAYVATMT